MKDIKKQLSEMRRGSEPDKAFKKALWVDLDAEFRRQYPAFFGFAWKRAFAASVIVVFVFVSTGMGTYAYASPNVTSGHTLYPVKQGIEEVEQRFHASPQARAKFHARMMDRRLREGQVMLEHGRLDDKHFILIADEMRLSVSEIARAKQDPESRAELVNRINMYGERYRALAERTVRRVREQSPPPEPIRNKIDHARVYISESGLDEEEKAILLRRLELRFDAETASQAAAPR